MTYSGREKKRSMTNLILIWSESFNRTTNPENTLWVWVAFQSSASLSLSLYQFGQIREFHRSLLTVFASVSKLMNADTVTLSVYLGCYGVIVYSGCVTCCRSWQRSRQHTCSSLKKKKKDSLATSTVVVVSVIDVVEIVQIVEMEGIRLDSTIAPPSQRRRRRKAHYHQLCTTTTTSSSSRANTTKTRLPWSVQSQQSHFLAIKRYVTILQVEPSISDSNWARTQIFWDSITNQADQLWMISNARKDNAGTSQEASER